LGIPSIELNQRTPVAVIEDGRSSTALHHNASTPVLDSNGAGKRCGHATCHVQPGADPLTARRCTRRGLRRGDNLLRLATHQVANDRQVMGCKPPPGSYRLASTATVVSGTGNPHGRTDTPVPNHAGEPLHRRMVEQQVTYHERQRAALGLLDQVLRFGRIQAQGFLHENVHPSGQGRRSESEVALRRHADRDSIDPLITPQFRCLTSAGHAGVAVSDHSQAPRITITDRYESCTCTGIKITKYVPTPTSSTDYSNAQIRLGRRAWHVLKEY